MSLSDAERAVYIETASKLKGSDRRIFMARVVKVLGPGGQRLAEQELGWNRGTIRKGLAEVARGRPFVDQFQRRGRRKIESRLPHLRRDLSAALAALNALDPLHRRTGYFSTVSTSDVRRYLIAEAGYDPASLPTNETLRRKLKQLNHRYRRSSTQP